MENLQNIRHLAVVLDFLAVGMLAGSSHAADRPKWEAQMSAEAMRSLACTVTFISHVVERALPDANVVMAKIHCEDKRSFDAVRNSDNTPFTFKECTPREQKSC